MHRQHPRRARREREDPLLIRISIDPRAPDGALVERAADAIRTGGVVAFPTDTLYGLAVNPRSADAVARLFDVKGRAADQAVPLIAADSAQVAASLGKMPALLASLGAAFWPGPLTVLVHAPGWLAPAVSAGTGRVGIRVPAHDVARALASAAGGLITATSANRSGAPASDDPDAVAQSIGDAIDVLVDSGRTPGGPPSTIVDITAGDVRLVRQGAVSWDEVLRCAARK